MKTPTQVTSKWRRQWQSASKRTHRLLGGSDAWPIVESIGVPPPQLIQSDLDTVIQHNRRWKKVTIGEVIWKPISYRATAEPVSMPTQWLLKKPTDWISACNDKKIGDEFYAMTQIVGQTDERFHTLLLTRRALWIQKPIEDVFKACHLAAELTPGCAQGKPLRTLSRSGIDTKFFERNNRLVTQLLDIRYDNEVSRMGLDFFLDALTEADHWILLADLDGNLLPFDKLRLTTTQLETAELPGKRLLIIENERCLHQLPRMEDTLAILGAGLDLGWTTNKNFAKKQIAYWGDLDTWGLQCLARARANLSNLRALLMTESILNLHNNLRTEEPTPAALEAPSSLTATEQDLYYHLLQSRHGRLEQEHIAEPLIHNDLLNWLNTEC